MRGSAPSERTRVRRAPERGVYDRAAIDAILDEGMICHLGFVHDGRPFVIPTLYVRRGDELLVHGSSVSRMLRTLDRGADACLTVTLLDGIVLARSVFNHSVNYRSVVVLGRATEVVDPGEKLRALESFTDRLVPGRWAAVRQPNARELTATAILRLPLDETSAKVRSGPPHDDEDDLPCPAWAGVIPLRLEAGVPEPAEGLAPGLEAPAWAPSASRR